MRIFRFLFCFFCGKAVDLLFPIPPLSQAPPDSSPNGRALLVGYIWEQGLPILRKSLPCARGGGAATP